MGLFQLRHTHYHDYTEVLTLEQAIAWGTLHFSDWLPQCQSICVLSAAGGETDEKELLMYLGQNHRAVNNELREYFYLQHMSMSEQARASRLQSARRIASLLSQRTIPDDMVLYRIIDNLDTLRTMVVGSRQRLIRGSVLHDKGFMSTSLVYNAILKEKGGGVVLRLLCPKGFCGAYVGLISHRPNEQEVLLPYGCSFTILHKYWNRDFKMVFDCQLISNAVQSVDK